LWSYWFTSTSRYIFIFLILMPCLLKSNFLIKFSFCFQGYQFCLVQGLNNYLLSDERGMDILSQNKEGIFSIFGENWTLHCSILILGLSFCGQILLVVLFVIYKNWSSNIILSPGYWGMYLLGVHLGNSLIFGSHSSGFRSSRWVRMRVWALSILFW